MKSMYLRLLVATVTEYIQIPVLHVLFKSIRYSCKSLVLNLRNAKSIAPVILLVLLHKPVCLCVVCRSGLHLISSLCLFLCTQTFSRSGPEDVWHVGKHQTLQLPHSENLDQVYHCVMQVQQHQRSKVLYIYMYIHIGPLTSFQYFFSPVASDILLPSSLLCLCAITVCVSKEGSGQAKN